MLQHKLLYFSLLTIASVFAVINSDVILQFLKADFVATCPPPGLLLELSKNTLTYIGFISFGALLQKALTPKRKITLAIIAAPQYFFSVALILYFLATESLANETTFFLILQTNFSEALLYITSTFNIASYIILSFFVVLYYFFIKGISLVIKNASKNSLYFFSITICACWSICFYTSNNHVFFTRIENCLLKGIEKYKEFEELRTPNLTLLDASKVTPKAQQHLVVIGESANRSHWSLYGYTRKTTPNIERIFSSCSTCIYNPLSYSTEKMTETSLAIALTNMSHGVPFKYSFSLIEVLKKAGYKILESITSFSIYSKT